MVSPTGDQCTPILPFLFDLCVSLFWNASEVLPLWTASLSIASLRSLRCHSGSTHPANHSKEGATSSPSFFVSGSISSFFKEKTLKNQRKTEPSRFGTEIAQGG
jgi:hypothetical protein